MKRLVCVLGVVAAVSSGALIFQPGRLAASGGEATVAAPSYAITVIGLRSQGFDTPVALNNRGDAVGYFDTGDLSSPWIYSDGVLRVFSEHDRAFFFDINDAREVVGWDFATSTGGAFLYKDGVFSAIGPQVVNIGTNAMGINEAGQIVGGGLLNSEGGPAFLWQNGVTIGLGAFQPRAINEGGQVVGNSGDHAVLYSSGAITDLGTLGGATSFANGLNDHGDVVGWAATDVPPPQGSPTLHAFLYSAGVLTDLTPLAASSRAFGINNSGEIVGTMFNAGALHTSAFLLKDGTMYDLQDLVPADAPFTLLSARDINESGQILVLGETHDIPPLRVDIALLLTPVSEVPDTTPPEITPNVSGSLGSNGWYTSNVTVSWSVSDPDSPLGPRAGCDATTVAADTAGVTFTCTATSAGGTSSDSVTVKRDGTPPTLACSVTPDRLWPANKKLVPVATTINLDDALAGPAGFNLTATAASDGEPATDIVDWTLGTPDTVGQLRAARTPPAHERTYTLTYRGFDLAGNSTTCALTVTVGNRQH